MLNKFRKIMKDYYEIDNVELSSNFKKDFNLSSMDFVNIICLIEREFNISFDEEVYRKLNTVGELVNYIEARKK